LNSFITKTFTALAGFSSCLLCNAGADFNKVDVTPNLESLLNPSSAATEVKKPKVPALRVSMLREAALSSGARAGLLARTRELVAALDVRASILDKSYKFSVLLTQSGVLPPVIVEANDAVVMTEDTMRVAHHIYRIENKARFVTIPPTWRDYLTQGLPPENARVELPEAPLLPKGGEELLIWQPYVRQGWMAGRAQADDIYRANMDRLNRDYLGMIRYSMLLKKHMVSEAVVARTSRPATGNTRELAVNDSVFRVTQPSELVTDPSKWKPVIK
jgi:defect-in-organelle-trafficking protein DotC